MMIEGEKIGLSTEPEFSSGEAVKLSRDALFNLLFQESNCKKMYTMYTMME